MAGTRIGRWPSKYGAKRSALVSAVRYSSQPEESSITESEAFCVVSVVILPLHPLRNSTKLFDGSRPLQTDNIVQAINVQLLSRLEFQRLANLLRYDHLEFWRHFHHFHCCAFSLAIVSIPGQYVNIPIDAKVPPNIAWSIIVSEDDSPLAISS